MLPILIFDMSRVLHDIIYDLFQQLVVAEREHQLSPDTFIDLGDLLPTFITNTFLDISDIDHHLSVDATAAF